MPAHLISTDDFCNNYQVEYSFIHSLQEHGLIEITTVNEQRFIDEDHLRRIERLVRLHYELDINVEGIEVISYLLKRIKNMQAEIIQLKNKLSVYEDGEQQEIN